MPDFRIAVVVSGFPRISETFALGELLSLEKSGVLAGIFATKRGDEHEKMQPAARLLLPKVQFLSEADAAGQARELAEKLSGLDVDGVHGYFAHKPAEVAAIAAEKLGVPFSFSVHAKDARKVEPAKLSGFAQKAARVIACNPDVVKEKAFENSKVLLLPHGIDLERFRPSSFPQFNTLRLLAVGRLVEKKGFGGMLNALSIVKANFSLRIVGDGPEREALETMANELGISDRVTFAGAKEHDELVSEYSNCHVVLVPSITDTSGDRDGLPNVVLEAMASERIIIASDAGAITSAVKHEETGIVFPQGDVAAMASAIEKVAWSPADFIHLARRARKLAETDFEVGRCAGRFEKALEECYA
jgi:glycosyltransferase involved in cell wall biosynthesis